MYRYRNLRSDIRGALKSIAKALPKIGQPLSVTGIRVINKWGQPEERVIVRGTEGHATWNAFLWGYGGEAPRALVDLLVRLGVHRERAEHLAFQTPRAWPDLGVDWHVRWFLPGNRLLVLRRVQIEELAQDERVAGLLALPKVKEPTASAA